jgi:hypothetical protein
MRRAHVRWLLVSGFAAAIIGTVGIVGCGSAPVAAPSSYAEFNSKGGTFALKYPEGWQADGGGRRGLEWAKFTSGPAEIKIDTGVTGSLSADIAQSKLAGDSSVPIPPEEEPIHGVHLMREKDAKEQFSGYKEVGSVEVIDVALGPARRSEFTADTTFGSGLHGYRATMLGKDKDVSIYCTCPESDWKTLQPAFDEVLKSVKRGQAEL